MAPSKQVQIQSPLLNLSPLKSQPPPKIARNQGGHPGPAGGPTADHQPEGRHRHAVRAVQVLSAAVPARTALGDGQPGQRAAACGHR